jgi:hypothetical protein
MNKTPNGITPPTPGLEHEEPDFWIEDDIPSDDGGDRPVAKSERTGSGEERATNKPERE